MTFSPGDPVRVRDDWPETRGPCHVRTPHYLRGKAGVVERVLGIFANPQDLAFGRPAAALPLFHVRFAAPELWGDGRASDAVLVELYANWLEPA